MLTRVEARTTQGDILNLPLQDPQEGFVVADIDGLDPVRVTIVTSENAQLDESEFQTARRGPRNMIVSLDLSPDHAVNTPTSLRRRLYGIFMPKSVVTLTFYTAGGLTYQITGRVEDVDAKPFAKEPNAKITLLCLNSDFVEPQLKVVSGLAETDLVINYDGSIETGFVIRTTIPTLRTGSRILQTLPNASFREMNLLYNTFAANDVVTVSTVPRRKSAFLTRPNGTEINILHAVDPSSEWLQLWPGRNVLRVSGGPYTIEYLTRHGGL